MENWDVPLLRSIRPEMVSEACWEEELRQPVFVWRRIASLFLHQFGSEAMEELLGSVLCNIPRMDFDKLFEMCPFFVLARGPAFVQLLHATGDVPLVIFCQTDLKDMTFSQRQASVAHELAHIILGHLSLPFSLDDPWRNKQQREADDLCRGWGFEIDNVRIFLRKKGEEENGLF